jgi:hypothetical protein
MVCDIIVINGVRVSDSMQYIKAREMPMTATTKQELGDGAAWLEVWNSIESAPVAWHASGDAARDAVVALIAYDNAGEYMTMLPEQALIWGQLRSDHAYILLRDYLMVRARISQQEIII